jgi:CheY-like chemotaxis protein
MRVTGRDTRFTPPPSILVVDDSADTADSTMQLLELCGYTARAARGGEEALREVAENPPDVVLLDLGLPGMDGWELARRLREQADEGCPVLIAVSGYGDPASRRRSADAGIELHLVKPVDPAVLLGALGRYGRVLAPA